jgi:hypothetical protein
MYTRPLSVAQTDFAWKQHRHREMGSMDLVTGFKLCRFLASYIILHGYTGGDRRFTRILFMVEGYVSISKGCSTWCAATISARVRRLQYFLQGHLRQDVEVFQHSVICMFAQDSKLAGAHVGPKFEDQ